MSEELKILKLVCQRLQKAGVPYMITGSIAANFYAVPRMTRDIDIVVEIKKEGIEKLLSLFQKDFYVDQESAEEAVEQKGIFNLIHNECVLKVDLIVRKDSPYRELEFSRRREVKVKGIRVSMVSAEDLILSKLFWAKDSFSEMQLRDVGNLLTMVKNIDHSYLSEWIRSLGLEAVYDKVKK